MGLFVRERRGISWTDQTLNSLSAPPLALMVFFGLLIMLMALAAYSDFKEKVERSKTGLKLFIFLLPLLVVLFMNVVLMSNRLWRYTGVPYPAYEAVREEGGAPWALLAVLVVVLVLLNYHSSVQSAWFRPL